MPVAPRPVPVAMPTASAIPDAVGGDSDALLEEFRIAPDELKTDVKKGCLLYFFAALALVALGIVALYFFFNRGR